MNFKRLTVFLFLLSALFLSCRFGAFNKDYPDSSLFKITLDGREYKEYSTSAIMSLNLDDSNLKGKYLEISIDYYKGENIVDVGGYSFSSQSIKIETIDYKSSGVRIDDINTLGAHIINCKSDVSSKFDKSFVINVSSSISDFDISYTLKSPDIDFSENINTASYDGSDIELISSSLYNFTISTSDSKSIPELEVSTNSEYAQITKIDNTHFTLALLPCNDKTKIELSIMLKNSSLGAVMKIICISKKDVIIELKDTKNDEDLLTLTSEGGIREYTVDLKTQTLDKKELYAYLSQQDGDENKSSSIKDELKRERISLSNHYMEFNFDGKTKTLRIIPKNSTTFQNDNGVVRNVFFYLYFFDSFGEYIKRFRICISPCVEKIKLSSAKVEVKAQKSGCIEATTYPNEKAELLWYFTQESPYSVQNPVPMKYSEVQKYISSMNRRVINKDIKISTNCYNANEYFFALSPKTEQIFYYTTLSQAKAMYIVVKPIDQDVFTSIPFLISGDSQIILKSQHCLYDKIVPSTEYTSKEEFEKSFITKNLPRGQEYPDTAEGSAGLVRTFYLPHNKPSNINLKVEPENSSVSISGTKQSKNILLASLEETDKEGEYSIEIEPLWYQRNYDFALNDDVPRPSCDIKDGQDAYGKNFYQYLGLGVLYLNIQGTKITLRIIIYDCS